MASENPNFKILMFPWLAHGHIFPFLRLSAALLNRRCNLRIYLCSTPVNFTSIQTFIHSNGLSDSGIEIVPLHIDSSPDLPPHYHTTTNLPSHLVFTLLKAFQDSNSSFSAIVAAIKPDLVVYDIFQPWAAESAAACGGVPAVFFFTYGAALLAFLHHRFTFGESTEFPFPSIRFEEHELRTLDQLFEFLYDNVHHVDRKAFLWGTFNGSCDVVLLKSTKGSEGKYLDYLSTLCNKRLIPVGPLVSGGITTDVDGNDDILRWLDTKPPNSTVFISFGSEHFLSRIEIEEIAKGLDLCNAVNFIWIIRFPAQEKITTTNLDGALPGGFRNRAGDRGRVVTGWAPQAAILAHPSTGGFMSHCGWSSVLESLYYGIPVIGMPIQVDQPVNAKMLVEAGSCVEIRRNEGEVFKGEEIARAMGIAFGEESGGRMRRRAQELRDGMKMEEGELLDQVAKELWELCLKRMVPVKIS